MFYAALAQLVERDLAKVEVTSSSLVCRSKLSKVITPVLGRNGRVAMHRIANPFTPVRLRVPPPINTPHALNSKLDARVVELVDTRDLKSLALRVCRFKSGLGHHFVV